MPLSVQQSVNSLYRSSVLLVVVVLFLHVQQEWYVRSHDAGNSILETDTETRNWKLDTVVQNLWGGVSRHVHDELHRQNH